jgi:hypothetical protein
MMSWGGRRRRRGRRQRSGKGREEKGEKKGKGKDMDMVRGSSKGQISWINLGHCLADNMDLESVSTLLSVPLSRRYLNNVY